MIITNRNLQELSIIIADKLPLEPLYLGCSNGLALVAPGGSANFVSLVEYQKCGEVG